MRNRSKNFYPIVKTPFLTRLLTFFLSSFCIFFYFIKAVSKVESDSLSLTNWIQAARYLCSIHSCDHICRHSANSSERYLFLSERRDDLHRYYYCSKLHTLASPEIQEYRQMYPESSFWLAKVSTIDVAWDEIVGNEDETREPPLKACSKKRSSFRSFYLNMFSKLKRIINRHSFYRLFYIFFFRGIGKSFMQLQECEFRRHWFWRSQSVKELKEILYLSRHPLCSMKTWVPPEACNKKRLTFVSQLFIWT